MGLYDKIKNKVFPEEKDVLYYSDNKEKSHESKPTSQNKESFFAPTSFSQTRILADKLKAGKNVTIDVTNMDKNVLGWESVTDSGWDGWPGEANKVGCHVEGFGYVNNLTIHGANEGEKGFIYNIEGLDYDYFSAEVGVWHDVSCVSWATMNVYVRFLIGDSNEWTNETKFLVWAMKNPDLFQGEKILTKNKDYFEGWYFKNTNNENGISFIPGINVTEKEKNAFIQVITNNNSYLVLNSQFINKYNLSTIDIIVLKSAVINESFRNINVIDDNTR